VADIVGARADCAFFGADMPPGTGTTEHLLQDLEHGVSMAYFYCHGGDRSYRHWLVLGEGDPLIPTYLDDALRSAWEEAGAAPLVVLNGCHTANYTPATFLSFVHRFGELGAAGIVGTEIPIHECLGRAFGEFLIQGLLAGRPVGRMVYDFRRDLLKRLNPLGLAYVAYCYADLHLEKEVQQALRSDDSWGQAQGRAS